METIAGPVGRFQTIEWVASTGSTNIDLAQRARDGEHRPVVRIADEQTAGRGRLDRRWEAPAGSGLLISFLVPWTDEGTARIVPTALGLAAVDALDDRNLPIGLKWPNDLVALDDRKVGGMLAEAVRVDGRLQSIVVGLGCNVSWPTNEVADLPGATALDALGSVPVDRRTLARDVIEHFDRWLGEIGRGAVAAVNQRYRERCTTLSRNVRVELTEGGAGVELVGTAIDIDEDGRLLVDSGGDVRTVDVGDVVHLRPNQGASQ